MGKNNALTKAGGLRGGVSLAIQLVVSLVISIIFSAVPFVLSLAADKSTLSLAIFMSWYSLFPPLLILLASIWLNVREQSWLRAIGAIWIDLSVWFLLQYVLSALAGASMLVRLLALPAMLSGNTILFLAGGLLFLAGGLVFFITGRKAKSPKPVIGVAWSSLSLLIIIALVILPLMAALLANPAIKPGSKDNIPSRDRIFGYISDIYNIGERRPGSEADHRAIQYVESKLRGFGCADVRVETSKFDYWEPVKWSLKVQPGASTAWDAETFYVPYSGPTPPDGVTADVVYLGNISAPKWQDVKDKIILVDIPSTSVSWDQMKLFTYMAYEPENTLKGVAPTPYPVGWMIKYQDFYKQAEPQHPAGIIGILRDYPSMGKFTYYAPYDGKLRSIPSLYLLPTDGDKLKDLASSGKTTVNLVLQANVSKMGGESANVYAVLPGRSSSIVMFQSHHDSPWRSGVEDSSGTGMVLALAEYYARLSQSDRPYTMVFLLTGGHMVGGATNVDFIARHQGDLLSRTILDMVIEHIADDYLPPAESTGNVQPHGVFLSENPVTVGLFATSIASSHISRTLLFPTSSPLGVPTDGFDYFEAGVPILSLISGPAWLFDEADTLDRVAKEALSPLAGMYIDFTTRLGITPEPLLRLNLTVLVLGLLILIASPLAALFFAYRKRNS
jgi:hypothetical protein